MKKGTEMDTRNQQIIDFITAVMQDHLVPREVVSACGELIGSDNYHELGRELTRQIFRTAREGLEAKKATITAVMNARFLDLGETKH